MPIFILAYFLIRLFTYTMASISFLNSVLFLLICYYHHLLLNLNKKTLKLFKPIPSYSYLLTLSYLRSHFCVFLDFLAILYLVLYYLIPVMLHSGLWDS